MAVAEEAVIANAVKPVWQHMDQEAADELPGLEGYHLLAAAVPVILVWGFRCQALFIGVSLSGG